MTAPKLSRAELRLQIKAARMAIQLREGTASDSDRQDCELWRAIPENERALQETQAFLRTASQLSRSNRARSKPRTRLLDSPAFKVAAGIAGFGAVCALLVFPPASGPDQRLTTQPTQWHSDLLGDGSDVVLGPNTALNFQVSGKERKVVFEHGEALFGVRKDDKPFVVQSGAISFVAVGTEFAIKQVDGPPEITVKEGKVQVLPPPGHGEAIYVVKGEQLTIIEGEPLKARQVNLDTQLAWVKRELNINGMTVAQVVTEFNRRNTVQIEVDETTLRASTVLMGRVRLDDPETFVTWLATKHHATVDRPQPNVLLLTSTKPGVQ